MRSAGAEERLRILLVRGLDGDADSYRQFLKELAGWLRGFFRRRLARLPDEVEDLVQETLLAVHNQRYTYDADQPLTAWAHAIARYKLVDMVRRSGRAALLTDPLDDDNELVAASIEEATDARRDLSKLLARLPDRQRLPIIHVKIEGLSVIEAATLTGQSVAAVKVNVHRGLKALARLIRNEG